ncbi:MAG: Ig-like domain repeat protein [Anaerolineales bacterium]|nr:Ig-like domain repeat protein [Anaerolineales bacterium]
MKLLATQPVACRRYPVMFGLLASLFVVSATFALWFDPNVAHAAGQIDMPGPAGSGRFGSAVTVLPNGNFVVTDPAYDIPDGAINVGAVYLYDGVTHAMISVVMGSTAEDQVGSDGVTVLSNGSFVIRSPNWANGAATMAGAVTWADATVGITGTVSAANSLVGSTVNDRVGYSPLAVLSNGNYVVRSMFWSDGAVTKVGAVTWGDGTTGATGVVSAANSLVGSSVNDYVGSQYPTLLNNGNYVVLSPDWDYSSFATNAGAVTWGNGSTGSTGVVSVTNSLVGTRYDDQVGYGGVTALTNGNYVVASPNWNTGSSSKVGAATWADGSTGITGTVSAANSLVGTATYDYVSIKGIVALTNGNYVVASPQWGNRVGAVTWSLGTHGITGTINITNSLVGGVTNDYAGYYGVVALTNGNYVVLTPSWQNYTGAVTWGNGATGITSTISAANSLVGTAANNWVGYRGVLALTNGNYVVNSARWDDGAVANVGAVTWGNGATGITGTISVANSLIGSKTDDFVGNDQYIGLYALTNGNYVVVSPQWDNDAATDAGAVTGERRHGTSGIVGAANSLVGSTANDRLGLSGLTNGSVAVLINGNYAVYSQYWTNGAAANAGAVTWGNGATGISGPVSASNSLVGVRTDDKVGSSGVTALTNGNYVFLSPNWANGTATKAGAFTWGNGSTGLTGTLTSTNSVAGARIDDQLGTGVIRFATGRYAAYSMYWDNGAIWNAGAVTWGNGIRSITGTITVTNSVVGARYGPTTMIIGYDAVNSQLIVGRPIENIVSFFDTREPPLLQLSKTVQPATAVAAGTAVTYTIVLVNLVDGVDHSVFFTDTLPAATSFARWVDQADAERTNDQITWRGVLTGSQPVTITFQVTNTTCAAAITNTALFSGSVHAGAASATYTAAKAETSTTLESGLNPATYGQSVVLSATVVVDSPCAVTLSGEQIAFQEGATTLGLATLDANGVATYTASLLSGGVHTLTAVIDNSTVLSSSSSSDLVQLVNKAAQTITFDPLIDRPYGVEAFTVTAVASSGLTVVFTTTTPSVCTVSDNRVDLVASGVCTLSASQPGDNNYHAAANVDRNFNLTCGEQVIVNSNGDSGYRTLRGAVTNLCEGGTITFAPLLASQTITLTSGQALTVTKRMTITGLGADLLAVSGNDVTRLFVIDPGVHAVIDGLTLRDGGLTGAKNGAGIQNNGALTVTNSALLSNSTENMGGGIYNTGALTLISSTVASNRASRGAGIYNAGALALQHIVLTNNDASTNMVEASIALVLGRSVTAPLTTTSVAMGAAFIAAGVYHDR